MDRARAGPFIYLLTNPPVTLGCIARVMSGRMDTVIIRNNSGLERCEIA